MEALTPYLANQRNQICIKLYTRVFKFLQNSTQRSGRDKAESDSAVFIPHDYAKSGFLVCIAHLVQLFYTRVFKKKKKNSTQRGGYDIAESDSTVFIAQTCAVFYTRVLRFSRNSTQRGVWLGCVHRTTCVVFYCSLSTCYACLAFLAVEIILK